MALTRSGWVQPVEGVTGSSTPIPVKGSPGATVQDDADIVVAAGGSTNQTLTAPASVRRLTLQLTGPSGSVVRIRKQGDAAGTGILLFYGGAKEYGGLDGAIPAAVTVQDVSSPAVGATVGVVWEAD